MCAPEKSCTCGLDVGAAQDRNMAAYEEMEAARMKQRPSVIYRPSIGRDGNQWSVLYGDNIMEGVCGYGDTPEKAMADFDKNWKEQTIPVLGTLTPAEQETIRRRVESMRPQIEAAAKNNESKL